MTLEQVAQEVRDKGHAISINKLWRIENGRTNKVDYVLKSVLEACFKENANPEDTIDAEPAGRLAVRNRIPATVVSLAVASAIAALVLFFLGENRGGVEEKAFSRPSNTTALTGSTLNSPGNPPSEKPFVQNEFPAPCPRKHRHALSGNCWNPIR